MAQLKVRATITHMVEHSMLFHDDDANVLAFAG